MGPLAAANTTHQYAIVIPMIGLGIAWASMVASPTSRSRACVREPAGVYISTVNMIVLPMLIENITFGWVYENRGRPSSHRRRLE